MAYSPQTNAVYLPLNLNCEHAVFGPTPAEQVNRQEPRSSPVRRTNLVHPESNGYLGEFRGDGHPDRQSRPGNCGCRRR